MEYPALARDEIGDGDELDGVSERGGHGYLYQRLLCLVRQLHIFFFAPTLQRRRMRRIMRTYLMVKIRETSFLV